MLIDSWMLKICTCTKKLQTKKYTEFNKLRFAVIFAFPSLMKTSIFDKLAKLEGKILHRYKAHKTICYSHEISQNLIADVKFCILVIKSNQSEIPREYMIIDKIKAKFQGENSLKYKPSSKQAWTSRTKPLKVPPPLQEGWPVA